MFCPQCGSAHTPGGRFCGNCGTLLPFASMGPATSGGAAFAGSSNPSSESGHEPLTRRAPPAFTLGIVACVVVAGILLAAVSAVIRGIAGDEIDGRATTQYRKGNASQGAMGALLLGTGRSDSADARKIK